MSQTFGTKSSEAFDEEMRFLIEDVNVLLDYLGRFAPDRLPEALAGKASAEFVQAGRRLAALIAVDKSAGTSTAHEGTLTNPAAVACSFLSQFALIAEYWSGNVGQSQFKDSGARVGPSDWAWLQSVRAALVELVSPATLDSILVTRAMLDALPEDTARPGRFRRFIQAIETGLGAGPTPPRKKDGAGGIGFDRVQRQVLSGRRLATHVRRIRFWTVALTVIVVSLSLFVGAGKTLVDERARQDALLREVRADIDRDIAIQAARVPADRSRNLTHDQQVKAVQNGERMHDTTLEYCQQPYRDHHGLVRYATAAQPMNCERLWGVNRAVNQTTREMAAWMALVFPDREERHFGDVIRTVFQRFLFANPNPQSGGERRGGFPEGPRRMTAYEAYHLAHRDCHVQQSLTGAQNTDNLTPTSGSVARHRSISQCIDEQINQWRSGNNNNNNLPIFYPTADQNLNQPRAIRAKLMIDAFSLYLLPVLFALLGSLVALNRDLRRVTDQWRLSLTERARGNTSLVLGAAFGAIVSLLAEVLRSSGATPQPTTSSTAGVALGLWPLAFLAGYSVTHVFRMLDAAVDRVFGAPSR